MNKEEKEREKQKNIDLFLRIFIDEYRIEHRQKNILELKLIILFISTLTFIILFLSNIDIKLRYFNLISTFVVGELLLLITKVILFIVIIYLYFKILIFFYSLLKISSEQVSIFDIYKLSLDSKNKNNSKSILKKYHMNLENLRNNNNKMINAYNIITKNMIILISFVIIFIILIKV